MFLPKYKAYNPELIKPEKSILQTEANDIELMICKLKEFKKKRVETNFIDYQIV